MKLGFYLFESLEDGAYGCLSVEGLPWVVGSRRVALWQEVAMVSAPIVV